jgi:hypothetical protein
MLGLLQLEEIHASLLCAPALVDALERHDPGFPGAVKEWLAQVEQVLVRNRLPLAAEVAALRGTVIAAEGAGAPPAPSPGRRTTPRRAREAAAAAALSKATTLVAEAIRGTETQLAEAERLMRQIVALAERKGLLPPRFPGTPRPGLLPLWAALRDDPELGAVATHIAGLAGPDSALILLDRALPRG